MNPILGRAVPVASRTGPVISLPETAEVWHCASCQTELGGISMVACSPDYRHLRVLSQDGDSMPPLSRKAGASCPCQCGHPYLAHQHYRKGLDCSLCSDCSRYRPAAGLIQRIIGRLTGRPGRN